MKPTLYVALASFFGVLVGFSIGGGVLGFITVVESGLALWVRGFLGVGSLLLMLSSTVWVFLAGHYAGQAGRAWTE